MLKQKYTLRLITAVLVTASLNGCAFSNQKVPIHYYSSPTPTRALNAIHHTSIRVGDIIDRRGEDPRLIIHKTNTYSMTTTGGYLAERPISTIVQNALTQGLTQIGYRTNDKAAYTITGTLNSIDQKNIMGMVQSTFIITVNINLRVANENGQTIWQDNFLGTGRVVVLLFGGSEILNTALVEALNDVIHQVQTSHSFQSALRK